MQEIWEKKLQSKTQTTHAKRFSFFLKKVMIIVKVI